MPTLQLMAPRVCTCLLGLSLALVATACGGGGGGGGTKLVPPVTDIAGVWTVDETPDWSGCRTAPVPDHYSVNITHASGSNTFTLASTTPGARTYSGTISGATLTYHGPKDSSDCSLLEIDVSLELQAPDYTHVSGKSSWTCSYSGGSCIGSTKVEATKQ
jgi:hypothetical protein